jgi:hypothetical protein
LRLGWEPRRRREQGLGRDGSPSRPPPERPARRRRWPTAIPHEDAAEPDDDDDDDDDRKWVCGGTLTMSSDHISISIGVDCECRTTTTMTPAGKSDGKSFGDEFYFRLSVSADFASSSPAAAGEGDGDGDGSPPGGKSDRKKCVTARKLRSTMRERLRSDPLVRRLLLVDQRGIEGTSGGSDGRGMAGVPLCEALIRRSRRRDGDLEERVNVHEDTLGGIRNAIFGHSEDNLDVLEIVLNMPYLPRGSFSFWGDGGEEGADPTIVLDATTSSTLCELAQRAYLRLLEDAMFDACEREGEDELLDDLTIS